MNAVPERLTEIVPVDRENPDAGAIARAASCLRRGGLVAFPTETVYGLGVHALDRAAVRRLFDAKGRPANDPLIVHVASFDQIAVLVDAIPPVAHALAARFWPGPLTLVMRRSGVVPDEVTAGLDTVAIRIPSHPVARALLSAAAVPVAAPSANLFSRPSPTRASHVHGDLDGRIDMILDGGLTDLGVESTVLDLAHETPMILRPGAVTLEMLRPQLPTVGPPPLPLAASARQANDEPQRSPGMLSKHYSPRAPLTLYEGASDAALQALVAEADRALATHRRIGILGTRGQLTGIRAAIGEASAAIHFEDMGDTSEEAGARLYAALRGFDAAGVELILAVTGPAEGLGVAIQDRLRRAAAGRIISC